MYTAKYQFWVIWHDNISDSIYSDINRTVKIRNLSPETLRQKHRRKPSSPSTRDKSATKRAVFWPKFLKMLIYKYVHFDNNRLMLIFCYFLTEFYKILIEKCPNRPQWLTSLNQGCSCLSRLVLSKKQTKYREFIHRTVSTKTGCPKSNNVSSSYWYKCWVWVCDQYSRRGEKDTTMRVEHLNVTTILEKQCWRTPSNSKLTIIEWFHGYYIQ